MKNNFLYYAIAWLIGFVAFNIIFFIIGNNSLIGYYWPGYIACIIAFAGQLFCGYLALKQDTLLKKVLNAPLLFTSYAGLVSTFSISIFFALRKYLNNWIGIVVLITILAITAIRIIGIKANADYVVRIDNKQALKTSYIKEMISKSEILKNQTKNNELQGLTEKVYESLRFSDPISNPLLGEIESKINIYFNDFENAIKLNDVESAKDAAEKLNDSIKERNILVKNLK